MALEKATIKAGIAAAFTQVMNQESNREEAIDKVKDGTYNFSFIMNPTKAEEIGRIAANGEKMPRNRDYKPYNQMIDIKYTEAGDIDLSTGDLVLTEPTGQHQRDILLAAQGDFKEIPELGVDSVSYLNDSDPDDYLRAVRQQMELDGMKVRDVAIDSAGELIIDAEYEGVD